MKTEYLYVIIDFHGRLLEDRRPGYREGLFCPDSWPQAGGRSARRRIHQAPGDHVSLICLEPRARRAIGLRLRTLILP